jgi:hypothetical protein
MNVNRHGSDWIIIKAWCLEQIGKHHQTMEAALPQDQYNYLRGQIAALRAMIGFAEPDPTPPEADADASFTYP